MWKTCQGEFSHEYAHGLWKIANKKIPRCEPNLIETRIIYCFSAHSITVKSSCFISEAYHSRKVFTGDSTDKNRSVHISCRCWSENAICKHVYTRGLIGIVVNEVQCISHRQVAWNRLNWKSDYDEWSWLLSKKSEIALPLGHWTALWANEFRLQSSVLEGPWERAEKRLGVQAIYIAIS